MSSNPWFLVHSSIAGAGQDGNGGRTPGAQISLLTRSGTNQLHGSLFEYFRNDKLDTNNWFANRNGLQKPALRQNDFGGVLGGRLVRDRNVFFVSYEGLRLRLPQTAITDVPSIRSRTSAVRAMRPFLNAYPLPNGPDVIAGIPVEIYGAVYPGGKFLNSAAFAIQSDLRQGTLGRNAPRGFGANQLDFSLRRTFSLGETWMLQFRSELFNILNHPNFGDPVTNVTSGAFGQSTRMLLSSFRGGSSQALSPLYQIGGPRSIQLSMKLML